MPYVDLKIIIVVIFLLLLINTEMINAFEKMRENMVNVLIHQYRLTDERVLQSMRSVPRHLFVDKASERFAYDDNPLPIGHGQTISQPYIVALMTSIAQINSSDKVLEIGTGCGYAAAVLSGIAEKVYTIETIVPLGEEAKQRLQELGYGNAHVGIGDGSIGWKEHAPYNAIIVACAAPDVPKSLTEQLAINGKLVIPVSKTGLGHEELLKITRVSETEYRKEFILDVRFVPLVGKEGYSSNGR